MEAWIEGAERIASGKSGATYREPRSPWRFVFHTMEAPDKATSGLWSTIAGLKSYIKTHEAPPHLWCWPERDWVGQCIPLTLSAYALKHPAGTPETNHKHAIQLEILGYARDRPCVEHAEWLGRRVLGPVLRAGVPINVRNLARSGEAGTAGVNGVVRMSRAQWAAFDGVCGHQNVPDNEHWDAGIADYQAIVNAAQEMDDMPTAEEVAAAVWNYKVNSADPNADPAPAQSHLRWANRFADLGYQWSKKTNTDVAALPDAIADAVVAKLPVGSGSSIDFQTIKNAVKQTFAEAFGA